MSYPEIIKETEFAEKIICVDYQLDQIRKVKQISVEDDFSLYLEEYLQPNAVANIVILHGFSEFCQKYKEMVWYYYQLGFNVFVYDQRDHGLSSRLTQNSQFIHVNNFEDYSNDLEFILNTEISIVAPNLELYIFAHSMGCAVAIYYCLKNPEKVKKMVLSSPFIALKTKNVPHFIMKIWATKNIKKQGALEAFPFQNEFNPNVQFADSSDSSFSRFTENLKIRKSDLKFQTSIATNGWMAEACKVKNYILNNANLSKIKTKILTFTAESENTVKKSLQIKLAKRLPGCRLIETKGSKHNIFSSSDKTLVAYYNTIFEFFCENL